MLTFEFAFIIWNDFRMIYIGLQSTSCHGHDLLQTFHFQNVFLILIFFMFFNDFFKKYFWSSFKLKPSLISWFDCKIFSAFFMLSSLLLNGRWMPWMVDFSFINSDKLRKIGDHIPIILPKIKCIWLKESLYSSISPKDFLDYVFSSKFDICNWIESEQIYL